MGVLGYRLERHPALGNSRGCRCELFVAFQVEESMVGFLRKRLLSGETGQRIAQYREAARAYEQAQREAELAKEEAARLKYEADLAVRRRHRSYWMSLSGIQFEHEVARLFRSEGYSVMRTPVSGDMGVDLVLRKDGLTTIVQCKRYLAPAGPAIVRELLGSKVAWGADHAILACTGGFTNSTEEFAEINDIELLEMDDLIEWSKERDGYRG